MVKRTAPAIYRGEDETVPSHRHTAEQIINLLDYIRAEIERTRTDTGEFKLPYNAIVGLWTFMEGIRIPVDKKIILDYDEDGDSWIMYNSSTDKIELYKNDVKRIEF